MPSSAFSSINRPVARRRRPRRHVSSLSIIGWVLLVIYSVLMIGILIWAILSSLKDDFDFMTEPFGWPSSFQFGNYATAWREFKVTIEDGAGSRDVYLPEMLLYSLIYSLGCAIANTLTCCIVGYLACKYPHKAMSKVLYFIVIFALVFPAVGSLPSEIQMARALHTYNSMIGAFFMKANFLGMNFLIFYAAFKSIPWDYAEAGFVDGASHFRVMSQLMFPMIKPTILAVFLLSFIGYWNDYYTPMIYLPRYPTASYGLYLYCLNSGNATATIPVQLAGCLIVFLPTLILFLLFKKRLIGNMTVGGLKG
jgi:ABC-type glycerol-3-phosphate transport system permease component